LRLSAIICCVVHEINYNVKRGEIWERLIVPKDRRTRRKRVPVQVSATVLVNDTKYVIPTTITSEGGVLLNMTPQNTNWLPVGTYPWDMVVTVSRSALLTSTPLAETLLVKGTLTVTSLNNLTPMESDGQATPLATVV
jgi:hypothetical protein